MNEYIPTPENQNSAQQDADKLEAIRHRNQSRDTNQKPQTEEYIHEEKDLSYVDENEDRLTLGKIVKYIAIGLIVLLFAVLFWRMSSQNKLYNEYFVWTDEAIAAYEEKKSLTVWVQKMASYHVTTEYDENYNALQSIDFTYYPYSDPNINIKSEDFEGCFMVGLPMYIEETQQFIITFRINRTAKSHLKEHYSLDYEPTGDVYRFSLSDGATTYTDYEYVTFSENSYFYYRLVFSGVAYKNVTGYKDIDITEIDELSLSVYFKNKYNEASPAATITVANSYCPIEKYEIQDALPAKKTEGLLTSPKNTEE